MCLGVQACARVKLESRSVSKMDYNKSVWARHSCMEHTCPTQVAPAELMSFQKPEGMMGTTNMDSKQRAAQGVNSISIEWLGARSKETPVQSGQPWGRAAEMALM